MAIQVLPTEIADVVILEPQVFGDDRGFFMETYHREKFTDLGLDFTFVQDNLSRSKKNVLRGLHYQLMTPQGKFVTAVRGKIFDVAVDVRRGSPTFGKWFGAVLSEENKRQMMIPEGFAHGFCVLSDEADVLYKCTGYYDPADDRGILWSDPDLAIEWPVGDPLLSEKDLRLPTLRQLPEDSLPAYRTE